MEDDPYYFLQQDPYVPAKDRKKASGSSKALDDAEAYVASLAPSYLKFDYQGRVIRLDSFSKTIAPGSRLGWFTCNEVFAERLERQGETSTQAPCGFGQVCCICFMGLFSFSRDGPFLTVSFPLHLRHPSGSRLGLIMHTLDDAHHLTT